MANKLMSDFVVDVGMHDGKDSAYYASRGYQVLAFEANPHLCADVQKRFTALKIPVEIRNRAISDEVGEVEFYVNRFNTTWSSLDASLGQRRDGADKVLVSTCRLDRELAPICDRLHYIKIDIEGYDEVALKQVLRLPKLPKYISVENGSEQMIDHLTSAGFDKFKLSNQRYVPTQTVPMKTVHGKMVEHSFERSSSGMWGEDLEGRWFTEAEIRKLIGGLTAARRLCPGNLFAEAVGWFDLHAKRAT